LKSAPTDLQATLPVSRREGLSWVSNPWLAAGLLLILSIVVRLFDLNQLARWDELWTMLAAQGWLREGVPRIAHGVYSRTELYTIFVAWCLERFGDNLVVARLPSLLAGSLLAVAVFLWTNAVAGRTAAWISGLLVALSSLSVEMSQYARFYTLQALTFWLGAIGVYALVTGQVAGGYRRLAIAAGTALSLVCALYLQILSAMGIAGLLVWLAVTVLIPLLAGRCRSAGQFWGALAFLALAAGLAVVAFFHTDHGHALLLRYLHTPLTVIEHEGQFWFYHLLLAERYQTFWPIFPFLALIAVAARPRPSLFAICVFGAVFVLLSFGGQKSWRYLYFALPFLFVVWAIALASIWQMLCDLILACTDRVIESVRPALRPLLRWGLLAGGFAFLLLANGSTARTILRPAGIHLEEGFSANWPAAVPKLEPWVRDADVVLTSHEVYMLYYLGRADVVVSKERLGGDAPAAEFARDPRTGLPVVSRPESLELILACYPSGVLTTDTLKGWRAPTVIDSDSSDLIERRMTPIDLPKRLHVKAFHWETATTADPSACRAIPGYK
jgi:hypothetical protein